MSENERYAFGDKSNGNKILQSSGKILGYGIADTPIAVYSEDNNSLTFCNVMSTPEIGSQFLGKTVTEVYTGIENTSTVSSSIPWREKIEDIRNVTIDSSFIQVQPASTAYWFYGMINCTEIDGLESLNTSNVTSMCNMFYNCSLIKKLDLHNFNTENATTMLYMFGGCSSLTDLDVSMFNTSKVTEMARMFYNCSSIQELDLSSFDLSNVTGSSTYLLYSDKDLASMFAGCTSLVSLDLSGWNAVNSMNMSYMFQNCSSLASIDLNGWATEKLETIRFMFDGCSSLTSIDISGLNTKNVGNMGSAFNNCTSLKTIYSDDNNFVTSSVTEGSNMFRYCYDLIGGNGTAYSSSNTNYTYAHVDIPDNPGYFTAK